MTGCRTSETEGLYVPVPGVSIERPVLEPIPFLDEQSIPSQYLNDVKGVISVYNGNLLKLSMYSMKLEEYNRTLIDYYSKIIKATD